jgi:hypothetical protein
MRGRLPHTRAPLRENTNMRYNYFVVPVNVAIFGIFALRDTISCDQRLRLLAIARADKRHSRLEIFLVVLRQFDLLGPKRGETSGRDFFGLLTT